MAQEHPVRLLGSMPIFGGLGGDVLERLSARCRVLRCGPGEIVVRRGELDQELFVVAEGALEVLGGVEPSLRRLARLGPGDCCGEMALVEIQPRSATVRALGPTVLYGLPHREFARLHRDDPTSFTLLALNLARELSRRLRRAGQAIEALRGDGPEPTGSPGRGPGRGDE